MGWGGPAGLLWDYCKVASPHPSIWNWCKIHQKYMYSSSSTKSTGVGLSIEQLNQGICVCIIDLYLYSSDFVPIPSRSAALESVMTDLSREMWYHGRISRTDAEKILDMSGGIEGNYLVRDSLTLTGEYVLSLCYQVGSLSLSHTPVQYPALRHIIMPDTYSVVLLYYEKEIYTLKVIDTHTYM